MIIRFFQGESPAVVISIPRGEFQVPPEVLFRESPLGSLASVEERRSNGDPSEEETPLNIEATYRLRTTGAQAEEWARAIAIELTVEVPDALIARYPGMETDIVARIESLEPEGEDASQLRLSFDPALAEGGLPQWLNLLSGNVSMLPGVELISAELPPDLLARFPGPRYGIEGIREQLGVSDRPLVAPALKPRGAPVADLAKVAEEFARGGGDVIKDDHNLVDPDFDRFTDRVRQIAAGVARGREESGKACAYHALLTGPLDELERRLEFLEVIGVEGVLICPSLIGFEASRWLLRQTDRAVWTHPSLSGAVAHPAGASLSAAFLHGFVFRLIGADAAVFVNHGGRFPISREECLSIAAECRRPRGDWPTTFPVPAGGMRLERIEEMVGDFGRDTILLVGGDLLIHPDGVEAGTRQFVERVVSVSA